MGVQPPDVNGGLEAPPTRPTANFITSTPAPTKKQEAASDLSGTGRREGGKTLGGAR
jgi:hypothetical protein